MTRFKSIQLPESSMTIAPDGSEVRILLELSGGGMAHFSLGAGLVSRAIYHRTVEEIWFVLSGKGEMWRSQDGDSDVVSLEKGLCITIPTGTRFQFRASDLEPIAAVGVTMPPWPGNEEAVIIEGPWSPLY